MFELSESVGVAKLSKGDAQTHDCECIRALTGRQFEGGVTADICCTSGRSQADSLRALFQREAQSNTVDALFSFLTLFL